MSDDGRDAPPRLTHLDEAGAARMVDVAEKPVTARVARAGAVLDMQPETLRRILEGGLAKGEVLQVARIAGIQGAKRTSELIPLCHPLPLTSVEVAFEVRGEGALEVRCTARVTGRTGVEMEALVGAGIASLTVYDMVKAIDRSVTVRALGLLEKSGGRSGTWMRGAALSAPPELAPPSGLETTPPPSPGGSR